MKGLFISFEGIEGSGKSTQIEKVADYFRKKGREVVVTKEPGATDFGKTIRELILNPETTFHSNTTEVLLFTADRVEHIEGLIKPALAAGKIVLCDRNIDSTYAYQAGGRQLPEAFVEQMIRVADLKPEVTFLLDLPVSEGLARAKARAALDRFEQEEIAFHERVRERYLLQSEDEPERIQVIECKGLSVDQVYDRLRHLLATFQLGQ
ncbi:dTMP kinase [bacterium]|jgi:dTMP kinase|nr:dTMP kinase [bacterium]